jgi:hypothetical protein
MSVPLERWARTLPDGLRRVESAAQRELRELGERARRAVEARAPRRSGRLARSIRLEVAPNRALVYTRDPAAATLEQGKTLHGRPWLAIPIGALRGTEMRGPRDDVADLFVLRTDRGMFLASRAGGALELRWKLQRQVTVPAQPFFRRGVDDARQGFEGDLLRAIDREVRGG